MIDERYKDIDNLSDEELVLLVLYDDRPEFYRTRTSVYYAVYGGLKCSEPMEYSEYVPQLREALKSNKTFFVGFVYANKYSQYSTEYISKHPREFTDRIEVLVI